MGSECSLGGGPRTLGSWAKDSRCFLLWDFSYYTMVICSPVTDHPVLHGQSICFLLSPDSRSDMVFVQFTRAFASARAVPGSCRRSINTYRMHGFTCLSLAFN